MWLAGAVALLLLAWPSEAHAWGPVTHLVHGSQILGSLSTLAPALQEILRAHRLPYLYGCIAADIVQAKKYTRSLYTHCHCWPVGWQLVESARGARVIRSRRARSSGSTPSASTRSRISWRAGGRARVSCPTRPGAKPSPAPSRCAGRCGRSGAEGV